MYVIRRLVLLSPPVGGGGLAAMQWLQTLFTAEVMGNPAGHCSDGCSVLVMGGMHADP